MRPSIWLDRLNALAPSFTDAAMRGALVLLLALAITHAMRRRSAAARHLVWVGAIIVQLALPVFAIWGPQWRVAVPDPVASVMPVDLRETPTPVATDQSILSRPTEQAGPSLGSARQEIATPISSQPQRISGKTFLLTLWVIGALFVLARLAIGTSIVASLARKGNRIDDGNWLVLAQRTSAALQITRPLTLLRGGKLGVPVTWGIVYPVVLLPDDADAWPEERRRFVLVHEMAHVKRFDALTQLAGQLALALFWFDPLVWIANRRMQLEREHACDDYVLRHGTSPSHYAEELLSMVRALGTPEHRSAQPAFAALAMARRSEFEGRMLSILDPVLERHPLNKGRTLLSATAALFLVVPLAVLHPYQRAANALTQHAIAAARDAQTATPATDLPESLTVSISTATTPKPPAKPLETYVIGIDPRTRDTTVVAHVPLASALNAFASGVTSLGGTTTSVGSKATSVVAGAPGCENVRFGPSTESSSTHIHSDNDASATVIDITKFNGQRCSSATIIGTLTFSPAEDDITEMPFGSHATFRERTVSDDRELTMARLQDGTIQRTFHYNGRSTEFDDGARKWFASYLPTVLMEAGINVGPRIARWRTQGGVDAVLARIATMSGTSAKRSHYEALLKSKEKLSAAELDRVVRSASENLRQSSSDLRAVLTLAAPNVKLSHESLSAIELALSTMTSSGDKSAVLQSFGQTDDRETLLAVMRAYEGIGGSGDKARLLQVLAARYLANDDKVLHATFVDHAVQITSSGDMRNVIMIAVPYATNSPDITSRLIEASRTIPSSGDRSVVMIRLVSAGVVNTKTLRDAFLNAAAEIPSEGDRSRVLQVAAGAFRGQQP
jgi:beta-lactamase regulating signal transducer with metallopeptidase domain